MGNPPISRAKALFLRTKGVLYVRLCAMRNRHLFAWDLLTQIAVIPLAYAIRLDEFLPAAYASSIWRYTLLSPLVKLAIFVLLGLYSQFWRFGSLREFVLLGWSAFLGSGVLAIFVYGLLRPLGLIAQAPRSIPFIDFTLTGMLLVLPRLVLRVANQRRTLSNKAAPNGAFTRVLIAGAGAAGDNVLRELEANPQLGLRCVGLVDDAPDKQGLHMRGVRVLGLRRDLPELVAALKVGRVIIAMPTAPGAVVRDLVRLCDQAHVEVQTLPGMYELLSGRVELERLRKVQIEDLLRREPVQTDREGVEAMLRGQRVLVTGAGGSIGGELCRQIARCRPAELVLLGHGENSLYLIGNELHERYPDLAMRQVLCDTRDLDRLRQVCRRYAPQLIYHAAAHKHVPLMEDNVEEAVTNNVLGTRNLLQVADEAGVEHLVMISTDKAVNPSSVMGATKRVAELLVQDTAHHTGRAYVAVRFGNVLGSRGSVVLRFQEQIERGGPVTVTHPEVKRYFMTIPEAVQLVLQAGALGHGGEVFFLEMGAPIKIVDLARDMIMLSGLQPDVDIPITFTGLRPGEKLFEELSLSEERYERSAHDKIYVCRNGGDWGDAPSTTLQARTDALIAAAHAGNVGAVLDLIRQLVPEYTPAVHESAPLA